MSTIKELALGFLKQHRNERFTVREIEEALDVKNARGPLYELWREGVIESGKRRPGSRLPYDRKGKGKTGDRRTIGIAFSYPAYLRQTFSARPYPEVIFIGDDPVVGPFCVHCGNPLSFHSSEHRCPNRHLHPLFPPPKLPTRV